MSHETSFDADAYLARVGLDRPPGVDEEGLRLLHHAQFHAIPFENLDIQLGRGIDLDPDRLFDKLVHRRRGGYCFELNGLLLRALRHFGFEARPLLARVHLGPTPSGRTHQITLVELRGRRWTVDAGFGAGGPRVPLLLEDGWRHDAPHWSFALEERPPWGTLLRSRGDGEWKDSYSFDLAHVCPADIEVGNHFTSTSPHTHFTRNRVVSRPTADGRLSLLDFVVTEVAGDVTTKAGVEPGEPYLELLRDRFGLELGVPYDALRPLPEDDARRREK